MFFRFPSELFQREEETSFVQGRAGIGHPANIANGAAPINDNRAALQNGAQHDPAKSESGRHRPGFVSQYGNRLCQ